MKTTFTLADMKKLRLQLIAENDPSNKELIDFYGNKIVEVTEKCYNRLFAKLKKSI